jgi:hypothetical protein
LPSQSGATAKTTDAQQLRVREEPFFSRRLRDAGAHATHYQDSMFFGNGKFLASKNSVFFSGPSGQRDKNGRTPSSQGP